MTEQALKTIIKLTDKVDHFKKLYYTEMRLKKARLSRLNTRLQQLNEPAYEFER